MLQPFLHTYFSYELSVLIETAIWVGISMQDEYQTLV